MGELTDLEGCKDVLDNICRVEKQSRLCSTGMWPSLLEMLVAIGKLWEFFEGINHADRVQRTRGFGAIFLVDSVARVSAAD